MKITKITRVGLLVFSSLIFVGLPAQSQSLEDFISRYTETDGQGYLQPMADALQADMNSGWYRDALINKKGFQLYFGVVTFGALVFDKQRTFTSTTPDYFTPQDQAASSYEVPTIFGDNEPVTVQGVNGTTYTFPGGGDFSMLPLAAPQISIGGLFGTEVSFRYYAFDVSDDVGDVSNLGWGVRHSISQYIDEFPLALAVGYYSTRLEIGDELDTKASIISLQGSYNIGKLTLYGGPAYEFSELDFSYESSEEGGDRVDVNLEGENTIRFTVGATVRLGVFTLNADYNIAKQQAFSLGIGVTFGKKEFYE